MRKIINSATTQYEPVLTEELVLDDRPISGSFNSITSDAVYKAISVDPGNVPPVESTDNGKVLTASYGEGGGSFEWATPEAPQSELPAYSSTEVGKVLGVVADYDHIISGQPATALDWVAQGGGSSYTAGDGININNNEISVRAGDGLELGTFTGALKVSNPLPPSAVGDVGKVLTVALNVDGESTPRWATPSGGGGGSSSSAFDTTFNLVNDGVTWRLSKASTDYINLTGGTGVYAYRVVAEITDSSNPTVIDDIYNVSVRIGSNTASETKTIYLKSDPSGYPDDPTSISFNASGILNISSAQSIRSMNVYVGIIPAKTSSAAVTSFTGGSVTLYLAKLSTLSGGWQPES